MRSWTFFGALLTPNAQALPPKASFNLVYKPESCSIIAAGHRYRIAWDTQAQYVGDKITISLSGGARQGTQIPIQDIANGVSNDADFYEWAVDASLGGEFVYSLVIKPESRPGMFQYSNTFSISAMFEREVAEETSTCMIFVSGGYGTAPLVCQGCQAYPNALDAGGKQKSIASTPKAPEQIPSLARLWEHVNRFPRYRS